VKSIGTRRLGAWFGSLNGCAPKFHLTPTIEVDLFQGIKVTFHWLGLRIWVKPWHNHAEAERTRLAAEAILGRHTA